MHANVHHADRNEWRLPPDETLQVADPKAKKAEVGEEEVSTPCLSVVPSERFVLLMMVMLMMMMKLRTDRRAYLVRSFVRRMLLPNVAGSSLLLLLVFLFGIDENV